MSVLFSRLFRGAKRTGTVGQGGGATAWTLQSTDMQTQAWASNTSSKMSGYAAHLWLSGTLWPGVAISLTSGGEHPSNFTAEVRLNVKPVSHWQGNRRQRAEGGNCEQWGRYSILTPKTPPTPNSHTH